MENHRFGYSTANTVLKRSTNTFCDLHNTFTERLAGLIESNLDALEAILRWNNENAIGIFQIGSGLIPFGAHSIQALEWPVIFSSQLAQIGQWAERHGMRLTMNAGPHLSLNSPTPCVVQAAMDEMIFNTTILASMGLSTRCKIVISPGGLYEEDKGASLKRFIRAYQHLPGAVKRRLVLSHDDKLFCLKDCLKIHDETGIPLVFNAFYHELYNAGTPMDGNARMALRHCIPTWDAERDGPPLVHFASQKHEARPGIAAETVDVEAFIRFFSQTHDLDYDIIVDYKDKEQSVLRIQEALGTHHFNGPVYQH